MFINVAIRQQSSVERRFPRALAGALLFLLCGAFAPYQDEARLLAILPEGHLQIDAGMAAGIAVDMQGRVYLTDADTGMRLYIASIRVREAYAHSCIATVLRATGELAVGMAVEWSRADTKNLLPPPRDRLRSMTNAIGMKLLLVPAGSFPVRESSGGAWRTITVERGFYLGQFEVTQRQFERLMNANPSLARGADLPVTNVSWQDAVLFCDRLSAMERVTYRLPTGVEWEYACRATADTAWFWGADAGQADRFAWYEANSGGQPRPVGGKDPNVWLFHDMAGNVYEWCGDLLPREGRSEGEEIRLRIVRGGAYDSGMSALITDEKDRFPEGRRYANVGFRVVREVK